MRRRLRRAAGALAAAATAAATLVTVVAAPASATVAKVQSSARVTSATSSISATLSATTAGDLLVATVGYAGTAPSFTAPSGWVKAVSMIANWSETEIWYYANNPGGITNVSFTFARGSTATLQLSEWSGVAAASPLDSTGTSTVSSTSVTVTASATVASGELAVTSFAEGYPTTASSITFTPGSGWTNLGNGLAGSIDATTADYRTGVGSGSVSETETSSKTGSWAAVIATFKQGCSGGSLTLTTPSSLTFPTVTLNGADQTNTATASLTPSDLTASAAGWNIQATSTTFTNAGGKTLPTTATRFTGGTASTATGNCSLPTNQLSYPLTLPAGATAPAAVKVFDATASTGAGPTTLALTAAVTIPASTYVGTYTSTWTFTIASGP